MARTSEVKILFDVWAQDYFPHIKDRIPVAEMQAAFMAGWGARENKMSNVRELVKLLRKVLFGFEIPKQLIILRVEKRYISQIRELVVKIINDIGE